MRLFGAQTAVVAVPVAVFAPVNGNVMWHSAFTAETARHHNKLTTFIGCYSLTHRHTHYALYQFSATADSTSTANHTIHLAPRVCAFAVLIIYFINNYK